VLLRRPHWRHGHVRAYYLRTTVRERVWVRKNARKGYSLEHTRIHTDARMAQWARAACSGGSSEANLGGMSLAAVLKLSTADTKHVFRVTEVRCDIDGLTLKNIQGVEHSKYA
jgi:hypothetical protein